MRGVIMSFGVVVMFSLLSSAVWGQPWRYDFGTATGSHTGGESTTFLPAPEIAGGIARVRIGAGGGSFNLDNPGVADLGSESELRGVAASSLSVNKFSIYDYTAGKAVTIRFTVRFGGGASGRWHFFNGDGANFADNNDFSGNQVFTGIRWTFGAGDTITTEYRSGSNWVSLASNPFMQNQIFIVDIYANNTNGALGYTYGTSQSLAPNKWDLWVNGVLVGDDLTKALLADDVTIDSWMFYGISSASNVATMYLDDILYTNEVSANPLPVQLSSFTATANRLGATLRWLTASEVNNYGFEIERRLVGGLGLGVRASNLEPQTWNRIGFIPGAGTSTSPREYTYVDTKLKPGRYAYRIKQVDYDGSYAYYAAAEVEIGLTEKMFDLQPNYPNPFNSETTIEFTSAEVHKVVLKVYNTLGQEVATLFEGQVEAGVLQQIRFDASGLPSGVYFARLESGRQQTVRKMLLMR
ncbi:MAG TPA: T9SS type A sorting domain-containing protein [Bacteroidota bacterium]|nr:T9SS type A sorting domain-containing protein [Bacteroidota bacterium]